MDVSSQPPNRMRWITGGNSRRTRWLVFFSGLFVLLLGLTFQVFAFPQNNVAYSAPLSHTDANPANPAHPADTSPTASGPPTLSLAAPSSGQGPVGAHLTIIGSNWGGADVLVGQPLQGCHVATPTTGRRRLITCVPKPIRALSLRSTGRTSLPQQAARIPSAHPIAWAPRVSRISCFRSHHLR